MSILHHRDEEVTLQVYDEARAPSSVVDLFIVLSF